MKEAEIILGREKTQGVSGAPVVQCVSPSVPTG